MNQTPADRRAENDKRVAADVEKFGCHVISVFDPEERLPTFSYSIGIQASCGAAEAIVVGLNPRLGHAMVNEYNARVLSGVRFERGVRYAGFLEGFCIYVEPAKRERLAELTLGCDRYYGGAAYSVVQLVYPTTKGAWPWNTSASEWFRSNQPMLGRRRPDRR